MSKHMRGFDSVWQYGTYAILAVLFSVIVFFNFYQLHEHILQMYDDYIYSHAASRFLSEGQYGWAGAKPGIAWLAILFRCVTPYQIIYLFAVFGLLTAVALYLIGTRLFKYHESAVIPALLWVTSPWYVYFSKTHHLICGAFYLFALFCWFEGIRKKKLGWCYIGSVLLACSVLTYYVMLTYLPFVGIALLFALHYGRLLHIKVLLYSILFFLIPIGLADGASLVGYVLCGKKNWPFLYSFWGQYKNAGHYNSARTPLSYYIKLFSQYEWRLTNIMLALGIGFLLWLLWNKKYRIDRRVIWGNILIVGCGALPIIFWILHAYRGNLAAERVFSSALPLIFLSVGYVFDYLPKTWRYMLFAACLVFTAVRVYANELYVRPALVSGFDSIAQELEASPFDLLVYLGPRMHLEQIVRTKSILALNVANDPMNEFLTNREWQQYVFDQIDYYLNNQGNVAFVLISNNVTADLTQWTPCFERYRFVQWKLLQYGLQDHHWWEKKQYITTIMSFNE